MTKAFDTILNGEFMKKFFSIKRIVAALVLLLLVAAWNFALFCLAPEKPLPGDIIIVPDEPKTCFEEIGEEFGSEKDAIFFVFGFPTIFLMWVVGDDTITLALLTVLNILLMMVIVHIFVSVFSWVKRKVQGRNNDLQNR